MITKMTIWPQHITLAIYGHLAIFEDGQLTKEYKDGHYVVVERVCVSLVFYWKAAIMYEDDHCM